MKMELWRNVFRAAALDLEMGGVELDAEGGCSLVSSQQGVPQIHIAFDAEAGVADIFAEIGLVPDDDAGLYREFLFDNYFASETKGAFFSASRKTGRIMLHQPFEAHSEEDGPALAALLASFAEVAYAGRRKLYRSVIGDAKETAGAPMAESSFLMRI